VFSRADRVGAQSTSSRALGRPRWDRARWDSARVVDAPGVRAMRRTLASRGMPAHGLNRARGVVDCDLKLVGRVHAPVGWQVQLIGGLAGSARRVATSMSGLSRRGATYHLLHNDLLPC